MRGILVSVLTAAACSAATDFSGVWKMDAAKSDWGVLPPPSSLLMEVRHQEPDLRVRREQTGGPTGDLKTDASYRVDGKPHTNRVGDIDGVSTLAWNGATLQITTRTRFQGQDIVLKDEWSLEGGGAALVIRRQIETTQATLPVTIHLVRVTPAAPAAGAAKLGGKWKMNPARSEFGFVPPFQSYEWDVEQDGSALRILRRSVTVRGESVSSARFTPDGSDAVLKVDQHEGKLSAKWDGPALVMTSQWQARNGDFTVVERWTLSPDGNSIVADTTVKAAAGEFPLKIHMDRQ